MIIVSIIIFIVLLLSNKDKVMKKMSFSKLDTQNFNAGLKGDTVRRENIGLNDSNNDGIHYLRTNSNYILYCSDKSITLRDTSTINSDPVSLLKYSNGRYNTGAVRFLINNIYLHPSLHDNNGVDINTLQYFNWLRIYKKYNNNDVPPSLTEEQIYGAMQQYIWGILNEQYDSSSKNSPNWNQNVENMCNWYYNEAVNNQNFTATGQEQMKLTNGTNIKITENGLIGPFNITSYNRFYGIRATVKFKENSGAWTEKSYTFTDSKGNQIMNSVYGSYNNKGYYFDTYSGEFYIKIPVTLTEGINYQVKVDMDGVYYNTSANWYNTSSQPMLKFERTGNTMKGSWQGSYSKPKSGSFELCINKKAAGTNSNISGALFKIYEQAGPNEKVIATQGLFEDGTQSIYRNNITSVGSYVYWIEEEAAPIGYCRGEVDKIRLNIVTSATNSSQYKISNCVVNYYRGDTEITNYTLDATTTDSAKIKNNNALNKLGETVRVKLNGDKTKVTVDFPNKQTGEYNLYLGKTTKNWKEYLPGAQFTVKENDNDLAPITTGTSKSKIGGTVIVDEVGADQYTITEANAPTGYKMGKYNKIVLTVDKDLDPSGTYYTVKSCSAELYPIDTSLRPVTKYLSPEKGREITDENVKIQVSSFDTSNIDINVSFDNEQVEGAYNLQFVKKSTESTTNISDFSDAIGGAVFKVSSDVYLKNGNKETISNKSIETENGKAVTFNENSIQIQNTQNDDTFLISEITPPRGYILNNNWKNLDIKLNVKKELVNGNYNVKSVALDILQGATSIHSHTINSGETYTYDALRLYVTTSNIIVEFKDPKTNYNIKINKVDADNNSNFLSEARFNIDGIDGRRIKNDQTLGTSGVFDETKTEIEVNKEYSYYIEETFAPSGYENIFDTQSVTQGVRLGLRIGFKIDQDGNIILNTYTTGKNYLICNSGYYTSIYDYIDVNANNETKTIEVTIKNPKLTKGINIKLKKYELNREAKLLAGAKFQVKEVTSTGSLVNDLGEKISIDGELDIDSKQNLQLGRIHNYYYEVIETASKTNYERCKIYGSRVKITVNEVGEVSSEVTHIYDGSWISVATVAGNLSDWGNYAKVNVKDNTVTIGIANAVKYNLNLYKKNYASNTAVKDAPLLQASSSFKVEELLPNPSATPIFDQELNNSTAQIINDSARSGTTYRYRITETSVASGYKTTLINEPIILNIRTDKDGKVIKEGVGGTWWKFENEADLYASNKYDVLTSLVELEIPDDGTNTINLHIANMPENHYAVQLVKVDSDGEVIKDLTSKFYVKQESSNPSTDGFELGTQTEGASTVRGILNISSNALIEEAYRHTYTIKETHAPVGFKKIDGNIKLYVDFTTNELLASNVTYTYDGTDIQTSDIRVVINDQTDIPMIQIFIPNESEQYKFELIKKDMQGNNISASVDAAGDIDGASFEVERLIVIPRTGASLDEQRKINEINAEYNEKQVLNGILENGTFIDKGILVGNAHYEYKIMEISPKSGYTDLFKDYMIFVKIDTITNNDKPEIETVDFEVRKMAFGGMWNNVTEAFKQEYPGFIEVQKQGIDKVSIMIKNTQGYKLRLNKTDKLGNLVDVASIKAYINAFDNTNNRYNLDNVKCQINGFYTIPGGGQQPITGESTKLSESIIMSPGDTQVWTIVEESVNQPYYNIFNNKYINVEVTMTDDHQYEVNGHKIIDANTLQEITGTELQKLNQYLGDIEFKEEDDTTVLNVTIKDPASYVLDIQKVRTDGQALGGATITVNNAEVIKDGASQYQTTVIADIGDEVEYVIKENSSANNYYNIFKDKSIIVKVRINKDGKVAIISNKVHDDITDTNVSRTNSIYEYYTVEVVESENKVQVIMQNPMNFLFQLEKTNTSDTELENAQFEIISPIVSEQSGKYISEVQKIGINQMRADGKIIGSTDINGISRFEEKNVSIGQEYEYKIAERRVPSSEYVNVFYENSIYVKVKVNERGIVELQNYTGTGIEYADGKNYQIRDLNGQIAPASCYEYVKGASVTTEEETGLQLVSVEVQNPTKFNIQILKEAYGREDLKLKDVSFVLTSPISGEQDVTTNSDGLIEIMEAPVKAGIYEYTLRENGGISDDIINILGDHLIKFKVEVSAKGTVHLLDENNNRNDNSYKIEPDDNDSLNDFVSVSSNNYTNIGTVVVKIEDPQKYNLELLKVDKITNVPMNDVTFDVSVFEENEDNERNEITLKDANTLTDINLQELTTQNVNGEDGIISIENILINRTGKYVFVFHERSKDYYKDIEDIYVNVYINVEDGKYKVTGVNVDQGKENVDLGETYLELNDDCVTVKVKVNNTPITGNYNLNLNKVDSNGKNLDGAKVKITASKNGEEIELYTKEDDYANKETIIPINEVQIENGELSINNILIEDVETYNIKIEEIETPETFMGLENPIELEIKTGIEGTMADTRYVLKSVNITNGDQDGLVQKENDSDNINIKIKNKQYDLALRKFITKINDKDISTRIPDVDITPLVDETDTTAIYNHTKEPMVVCKNHLVTYTIRVYNEGPEDAYASLIKDDIPEGLEFVQCQAGDGCINEVYRWKLVDEEDNEVTDKSKAKYIVSDYLSKEQEKEEGENLLKAFNKDTMTELDYRDVKVQFKVIEPDISDRILINYAQIAKETDSKGKIVTDRDSTPNVWKNEDDEDIEKIKLQYFDLALRKWVTQAIVTENGKTIVTETGHRAEDNPEDVVKVDLKKSKLNNVIVKFKYSIRVTNEGQIAGEATEIRDDIPKGLKFIQEDNPDWKEENGQIVTNKLEGITLWPGESAEVEIILTWVNSANNMGVMVNTAEINKDHNDYGAPDIDSVPGNFVPGEDDIDDAPVMLSIKTGSEYMAYIGIIVGTMSIIIAGAILIKRNLLR